MYLSLRDSLASADNASLVSVVTVVHEDRVILGGVEHLRVLQPSQLLHLLLVLRENSKNNLGRNVLRRVVVVLLAHSGMIPAGSLRIGKREQLAGPRVLLLRVDHFVRHVNDVVGRNSRINQILQMK